MNICRASGIAALCAFAIGHTAIGQTASFRLIEGAGSANDITPDGRWIVGERPIEIGGTYRYDALNDVLQLLPPEGLSARAISDDGTIILGSMPDPVVGAEVAAIWRASTNQWESIGALPNAGQCPSISNGYELTGDGQTAVGLSWDGCSGRGFVWTEDTGMVELQPMANGGNRASVISDDGSVIGGFSQGSFSRTPTIWNSSMQGQLLDPPSGDIVGEILGMKEDGSILLGTAAIDPKNGSTRAVKWTTANGFEQIGNGSWISAWSGNAMDIANDGTIVGFDFFLGNRLAWIQPQGEGDLIQLVTFVQTHGGTIPGGTQLHVPQAITPDGSRIIGHTAGPGAWIIDIELSPACAADLNGDGVVNGADLASLLASWNASNSPADLNGDGIVDGADLASLLALWNMNC